MDGAFGEVMQVCGEPLLPYALLLQYLTSLLVISLRDLLEPASIKNHG